MNRLSITLFVLGLILFAIILTACNGSAEGLTEEPPQPQSTAGDSFTAVQTATTQPPESTPANQGTITIWHGWDDTQVPALVEIISAFQSIYPGVHFDVLYVPPENLLQQYTAEAQKGGGPGLLLGPAEWGLPLFDNGLVMDISQSVDQAIFQGLNQAALDQVTYKGAIVGLPYRIQGVLLYRNRDLIIESADTFDYLVSLAQSATVGDNIGAILDRGFYFSGGHLEGVGGELMDEEGFPAFNNQNGINWINLLLEFENAGPTEYNTNRDLELFQEGRVGYILDGSWNLMALRDSLGADVLAIDPWPSHTNGSLAGYVQGDNLFVNSNLGPENQELNFLFLQHFMTPESQSQLANYGFIPAITGLQLVDSDSGRLITQAMIALSGGSGYPALPVMSNYLGPMDAALRSVFDLGIAPGEALQNAESEIETSLASQETTPVPDP